jgi:hypothetical protein
MESEYCIIEKFEKKEIDERIIEIEKKNKEKFKTVEGLLYYNNIFLNKCDVLYIAYSKDKTDLCGEAQITVKDNYILIDKIVTRNFNSKDRKFNKIGSKIINKIIDDYKNIKNIIGIYVAPFPTSIGFYTKNKFQIINDRFMCYYFQSPKTIEGKKEDIDKTLNFFKDEVFYKRDGKKKSKKPIKKLKRSKKKSKKSNKI